MRSPQLPVKAERHKGPLCSMLNIGQERERAISEHLSCLCSNCYSHRSAGQHWQINVMKDNSTLGGKKLYFSFISFWMFTCFLDTLQKKKKEGSLYSLFIFSRALFFPPLISRSRLHRLRRRICCWGCFGRHRRPQQIVWKEEGRFWCRKKVWFPTLPFC